MVHILLPNTLKEDSAKLKIFFWFKKSFSNFIEGMEDSQKSIGNN